MRAILSVSDKTGLVELARGLSARSVELISTGGTAKALAAEGLPVTGISDVTGFPEMMDGRVKTLHPAVHGGILARRHRPDDLAAIAAQGIRPIDLVVVNLYPFAKAAANPETPFDALVEEIDIGGPSLLRAAAKNFRDVLVVVDPADYPRVLEAMDRPDGPSIEFRFELMKKAFAHTAQYDGMIAMNLMAVDATGGAMTRKLLPQTHERRDLRYGENPHQKAVWMPIPEAFGGRWHVHQGKELSFTNLLDLDAALRIVLEFDEPAAAVIKHTNPCGVASGASAADAYVRARDADALSAFGGIVGLNRELDADAARALTSTFIEAVIAPSLSDEARGILAAKQNLRVVTTDFARARQTVPEHPMRDTRSFLGGMLMQEPDRVIEAAGPWPPSPPAAASASQGGSVEGIRVVTKRQPTAEEWVALRFAWRVCAHVKSNAVIFTAADRTLAIGAGQMSRVDAVKVAVMKATVQHGATQATVQHGATRATVQHGATRATVQHGATRATVQHGATPGVALAGSVAASDAFFPFRDGLDAVAEAGATAVVQPGGSVRDAEVIAAADERGLAMVFTGRRHFRH